jgi:hypothetical protein
MPETGPIQVEVAYPAVVTQGTGRTPWQATLALTAPVLIPEAEPAAARVVVEVEWPQGGHPPRMSWREHGGALWRPLVAPDGDTLDDRGGFARGIEQALQPAALRVAGNWTDYPFNLAAPGGNLDGREPFGAMREGDPGLRVRSSNREAAMAAAQRKAADDLLLVDGVLHMRSRPPVWAVGRRNRLWVDPGLVRLVVPDLKGHDDWLASFPLDRREDAIAFAALHAERLSEVEWFGARDAGREPVVEEAFVRHDGTAFPDTRADDLRRVFEGVERNLRSAELGRFERRFLKAYGDLGAIVDEIAGDGHEAAWPDDADAAIGALVAAGRPEWPETWSYAAEVVESMRSLAQRSEMVDRLTAEADASWIAGTRP